MEAGAGAETEPLLPPRSWLWRAEEGERGARGGRGGGCVAVEPPEGCSCGGCSCGAAPRCPQPRCDSAPLAGTEGWRDGTSARPGSQRGE